MFNNVCGPKTTAINHGNIIIGTLLKAKCLAKCLKIIDWNPNNTAHNTDLNINMHRKAIGFQIYQH